jgi:hypothetical protein
VTWFMASRNSFFRLPWTISLVATTFFTMLHACTHKRQPTQSIRPGQRHNNKAQSTYEVVDDAYLAYRLLSSSICSLLNITSCSAVLMSVSSRQLSVVGQA